MSRMGEYAMEMEQYEYPTEEQWWSEQDKDVKWEYSHNKPEHDMNINDMKESKYIKKQDVEPPIKVTIKNLTQEDLAMQGQPPEMKWVVHFNECKPLVLNSTNGQLIAMALGSPESDDWTGKEIVLFNDPNVSFGGKLTGGVRARGVKQAATAESENPAADIPF